MKVELSVVIITFNEERNIERCLISVKDIADEIIVLDSFSTDKTEEICNKYKVRFFQHKFDGHIQQKNRAITYSNNNYILSVDADEEVSSELNKSIIAIKENCNADGYFFNRLNNYCGKWIKHTSWYPDKKLRLWDKTKGEWGGENPHDKFIMQANTIQKYLKGDLKHYSYNSITEHVEQANKFSGIAANTIFEKGNKSNFVKVLFKPYWKFFREYFFKLGFLDGFYGLVISVIMSYEVFLKYTKLYLKYKNKNS